MLIPIKMNSALNDSDFIGSKITVALIFDADEHQTAI